MFLKSLSGKVLYESRQHILKDVLLEAIEAGVCLKSLNLRKAKLDGIVFQNVCLDGACLWGASLKACRFVDCSLAHVDLRLANLCDVSINRSSFKMADFRGVNLESMKLVQSDFSYTKFSDPAVFSLDVGMNSAFYQAQYISSDGDSYLIEPEINTKTNIG